MLSDKLLKDKFYTTGALRNRIGGPLISQDVIKEADVSKNWRQQKNKNQVLEWHDKKPVAMISNVYECSLMINAKNLEVPELVRDYIKYMGGIDKFEQVPSSYRKIKYVGS